MHVRFQQLDRIEHALMVLGQKVDRLMAQETDLQADLDAIKAGVAANLVAAQAQAATIADLKAQLLAGTPVSQTQLDALDAEAKAIVVSLTPASS